MSTGISAGAGGGMRGTLEELRQLRDDGLIPEKVWEHACERAVRNHIEQAHHREGAGQSEPPSSTHLDAASEATRRRRAVMESDQGAAARIELAAAYRMAAQCGLNEADQNHFTVVHPTKPHTMLLIPQG